MADATDRTLATEASLRWLAWLAAGLGICLTWALITNPPTPRPVGAHREVAALMLTWIDEARAAPDLAPLTPSEDVALLAEAWSAAMAERVAMEHNPSFGTSCAAEAMSPKTSPTVRPIGSGCRETRWSG